MQSLVIGIIAALAWGVHDVCVRFVSQRVGVNLAYLVVLVSGLVLIGPMALVFGDWQTVSATMIACAMAAGAIYAGAGYCLYRAFSIGPVRLVAPVIGAYPILSLAWAAAQGNVPLPGQMVAALMVIAGVGAGALLTDEESDSAPGSIRQAMIWALMSMTAFALSFALGQMASQMGDDWPTMAISRTAAMAVLIVVTLASRPPPKLTGVPWALLCFMGLCDALALGLVIAAGRLPHPEFAAVSASTQALNSSVLFTLFQVIAGSS